MVEEMMERMKLSAAERKGICVGAAEATRAKPSVPKAIDKYFMEKLVNADGLAQALGRI